jgi:hypothetical protein
VDPKSLSTRKLDTLDFIYVRALRIIVYLTSVKNVDQRKMVDDNFGAQKSIKNILKVFRNMALRKIFAFRRKELTECRRQMHNEEFNNLHSSPDITGRSCQRECD